MNPLLEPKGLEWIRPGSSQGRQIRGDERNSNQQSRHHSEREWVRGFNPVKLRGKDTRESDGLDATPALIEP